MCSLSALAHQLQRSFQALLPAMIQVIGQCVETGNENGARPLFDVLETLLILVSSRFVYDWCDLMDYLRKFLFSESTSLNLLSSCSNVVGTALSMATSAFLHSMHSTGRSSSKSNQSIVEGAGLTLSFQQKIQNPEPKFGGCHP